MAGPLGRFPVGVVVVGQGHVIPTGGPDSGVAGNPDLIMALRVTGAVQGSPEGDHLVVAHDDDVFHVGVLFQVGKHQIPHGVGCIVGFRRIQEVGDPFIIRNCYRRIGFHLYDVAQNTGVAGQSV